MKKRLKREQRTVYTMILMYCSHFHSGNGYLCNDCDSLWKYANDRIQQCMLGYSKPVCSNCPVHCYNPEMRERIREVMRYAGPRMIWKHPWFAIMHIADKMLFREDKVAKKIVKTG